MVFIMNEFATEHFNFNNLFQKNIYFVPVVILYFNNHLSNTICIKFRHKYKNRFYINIEYVVKLD